jgi:23S rRNA (cytidine2498-2'-O)-methyltransferase
VKLRHAPVASDAPFLFALCQRGAEAVLKREVTARTGFAPAYQRPGLVTFRATAPVAADFPLDSVFARTWGLSLGMADSVSAALALAAPHRTQPLRVHVIERDLHRPDEEPRGFVRGALAESILAQFRALGDDTLRFGSAEQWGELVLDVVVAPEDVLLARGPARVDPWLIGLHRHAHGRSPHPGGRYPFDMPEDSPSRAYAKIEEAIQAFALPVRSGDVALELGAAPGGAAYALARRGVSVLAVDPAEMAGQTLAFVGPGDARITHLPIAMAALTREQLPRRIDWLLMDVHLAPQVALHSVRRIVPMLRPGLRGVVFTLKLNDWAFADKIETFLTQVQAMGIREPRARQLPSHRQEIAIAGLVDSR